MIFNQNSTIKDIIQEAIRTDNVVLYRQVALMQIPGFSQWRDTRGFNHLQQAARDNSPNITQYIIDNGLNDVNR